MAKTDEERRVIRARVKANMAFTRIEKGCAAPTDVPAAVKQFIAMCMEGPDDAPLVGKMLSQKLLQWERENFIQ